MLTDLFVYTDSVLQNRACCCRDNVVKAKGPAFVCCFSVVSKCDACGPSDVAEFLGVPTVKSKNSLRLNIKE